MNMVYNRNGIFAGIFAGLILLCCIGGVYGAEIKVQPEGSDFVVLLTEAPNGIAGFKIEVTVDSPAMITGVTIVQSVWGLNSIDPPDISTNPKSSVTIAGVDLQKMVQPGATDVELFRLTATSDVLPNQIRLQVKEVTDDSGSEVIDPKPTATQTIMPTATPTLTGTQIVVPTGTQTAMPTVTPTLTSTQIVVPTVTPTLTGTQIVVPTATPTPTPVPGILAAGFKSDKTFGFAPLTIRFTDESTGSPETYFWEIRNGEGVLETTSVVRNPQHIFRKPGIYNVKLTVSRGEEINTAVSTTDIIIATPRPIPVPRQNGILSIGSIPQGADIYLNGAYYGKTPIRIDNLTPNAYQVRLKMPGYYDSVTTIPVWKGPMPSYGAAVFLKAVPPNIGKVAADPGQTGSAYIVTYPEGVDVYFEGASAYSKDLDVYFEGDDALIQGPFEGDKVGTSDLMITKLPVGVYDITLKRKGFADWPGQIEILVGKTVMQVYHYDYPTYHPVASEYFNEPDIAEGDE
jgi:PKD repeat protein